MSEASLVCNQFWRLPTVWPPYGANDNVRWLKPIELRVHVLLLNIRVVCSLANPLKRISLRQSRGDSIFKNAKNQVFSWAAYPKSMKDNHKQRKLASSQLGVYSPYTL